MKLTFEGITVQDIFDQMESVLASSNMSRKIAAQAYAQDPGPEAIASGPVDKSVEKPVDPRILKMRAAKAAKKAERERAAAVETPAPVPELAKPSAQQPVQEPEPEPVQEALFDAPEPSVDPAELVKVRQKTIADLQQAYANGHHKEVLVLLSRHGNGAKSFRELPPEAFLPIRKAIDLGALE